MNNNKSNSRIRRVVICNLCNYVSYDLSKSHLRCDKCNSAQLMTKTVHLTKEKQDVILEMSTIGNKRGTVISAFRSEHMVPI